MEEEDIKWRRRRTIKTRRTLRNSMRKTGKLEEQEEKLKEKEEEDGYRQMMRRRKKRRSGRIRTRGRRM